MAVQKHAEKMRMKGLCFFSNLEKQECMLFVQSMKLRLAATQDSHNSRPHLEVPACLAA